MLPHNGATTDAPATQQFELAKRMGTYDLIYGIPHDLLVLLNKPVHWIDQVIEERRQTGTRLLSSDLAPHYPELEEEIMARTAHPTAIASNISNKASKNLYIIKHMTKAFHDTIKIYFAQHVRLLGHFYIQPFITSVIKSLEVIERIKTEVQIFATPLYWPAFIAASEAFDPVLQELFRKWYSKVKVYAIGNVRTGFRMLTDVWSKGPCTETTLTSLWRLVIQDIDTVLLLA